MTAGVIPKGAVDERSITEIQASDLVKFRQVHLFAGIAGWPEALRLAGFCASRSAWTLSCPCQPFSVAGKGKAEQDKRHLWPEARRLIAKCRPPILFGEQVASKAGKQWFSGVRLDLEALGYRVGAADLCSPCVGAPHIRQRLYFGAVRLADTEHDAGCTEHVRESWRRTPEKIDSAECCGTGGLAHSRYSGGQRRFTELPEFGTQAEIARASVESGRCSDAHRLGNSESDDERRTEQHGSNGSQFSTGRPGSSDRLGDSISPRLEGHAGNVGDWSQSRRINKGPAGSVTPSGPWSDSAIVHCLDGKQRRTQSGIQPLAHGVPRDLGFLEPDVRKLASGARRNRKGRLHGYGDSIVPPLAAMFIRSFLEAVQDMSAD